MIRVELRHSFLVPAGLALSLVGAANGQQVTAPPVLTVRDAVAEALAHNARLLDSQSALELANLGLRQARSEFTPKFTPGVLGSFGQTNVSNQTYGLDVAQRFVSGTTMRATLGATTFRNQLGNFYSTDTTLQVGQSLLRGFGRGIARHALTSAETRVADAARQHALSEQQIALEVASTYYGIVSQQRLALGAERAVERSRRLLEASEARLKAGRVSQLDVFRAQQLVAEAEGQLLDAQAAEEDAKDQLRQLLGRGSEYDFTVVEAIPPVPSRLPAEEIARLALENRLELQTALNGLSEAERSIALARNQRLPQFDVNLAFTRRETADDLGSSFGLDRFKFATFIGFSMPVDRTAQTVAYQTAAIERDRHQRELDLLRMRIESEARRAVRQQERLIRSLEAANSGVEFAQKEMELAALRYQRGLSNNLDVVNAEENLLAAEARRSTIQAELAIAYLQVRAAAGILDPRKDID